MTDTVILNSEQRKAAGTLDGPVLILAGPGTGKTQLLSVRAANIMKKKRLPGENLLILTYTNAAAKSVKERLVKIVGFEGYKISAETFHGFANSVILDSEEASSYMRERIQMTNLEKIKCLEYILDHFTDSVKELRPFGYPYLYVSEISRRISELKNEGVTPRKFEKTVGSLRPDGVYIEKKHTPRLKELSFIYRKYEELKEGNDKNIFDERGRYDYDDMIILATHILKKEPYLKASYKDRYKYIMVDEFQDTNGAQLELLLLLCDEKNPNLCCVGDDDQSIYRFQGATLSNFRILKERFPDLVTIKLKNNYRSTDDIIQLSTNIIRQVPREERLDAEKKLFPEKDYRHKNIDFARFSTEDEEVLYIIRKIREIKSMIERDGELAKDEREKPYNQIAILVRKRSFILKLIDNFLRVGIPYATDGKEDISGQKRVRQMIDVLKLARFKSQDAEERDLVLYRVLSCDFLEIPKRDIFTFINFANKRKRGSATDIFTEFINLFRIDNLNKKPSRSDVKKISFPKQLRLDNKYKLFSASWAMQRLLGDAETRPVHDLLMGFIQDSKLYKFIMREYESNRILLIRDLRSLTSFVNMVKNLSLSRPDLTLSGFMDELETMKNHNMPLEGDLVTHTQDGVRIMTAHASKGMEFHTVIIPFCIQDKSWPLKPLPDRLPLPSEILATKRVGQKSELAKLSFFDEVRLFYVASSRAKSSLIYTSSPSENSVSSSFFDNLSVKLMDSLRAEEDILGDFLRDEKNENPLHDTENVLRDLVKNMILTPTKLNSFIKCPRRFLYDNLLLLPGKKKQSLVFGNCTHKALEEVFRFFKDEKKFPPFLFFRKAFERELRFQGVNKTIEKWCLAKLDDLKAWFEKAKAAPVMPIDLEKKKIITLKGGIVFSGKYDKVEFEDEKKGNIRIVDYKTGKPDEHVKKMEKRAAMDSEDYEDYLRQLVAYKLLYERDAYERTKYTVTHGVLAFLEPIKNTVSKYGLTKGQYIDKKVEISTDAVNELEKVIIKIWQQINKLQFDKLPVRDAKKCKACAFDSICWEE